MMTSKEVVEYLNSVIETESDRSRIGNILYEITKDEKFKEMIKHNFVVPSKNIDKVKWLNTIERIKERYNRSIDEREKCWIYQAYVIARLYSETRLSISEIAKIRIDRIGKDIDSERESNVIYYSDGGYFHIQVLKGGCASLNSTSLNDSSCTNDDDHYLVKLNDDLSLVVNEWISRYNMTLNFVVNTQLKAPKDARNYISKRISRDFDFPKIK